MPVCASLTSWTHCHYYHHAPPKTMIQFHHNDRQPQRPFGNFVHGQSHCGSIILITHNHHHPSTHISIFLLLIHHWMVEVGIVKEGTQLPLFSLPDGPRKSQESIPKPPQLTSFSAKEHQFYSKTPHPHTYSTNYGASHLISKVEHCHPLEEVHSSVCIQNLVLLVMSHIL